ncbi:MAG: hypothetical protein AAB354_00045, partial [candidate division KSB1 bacterium]
GLTITGVMNIPVGEVPFPVILMNHGFFARSVYSSGDGTDRSSAFLAEHGYAVAPVTIDNSEWIFAHAYVRASERGDAELQRRVGEAYVPYMERKFEFYEKQSRDLFGREIKQTLLVHANLLNADYFDALAAMLVNRGYAFITLEEALRDEAYHSQDTYVGPAGISWLQRWAMTLGKGKDFFAGEPRAPEFVVKAAGLEAE